MSFQSHKTTLGWFLCITLVQVLATLAASGQTGTWTKQAPIPSWYNIEGIAAISPDEVWIASSPLLGDVGTLAHTRDGGVSWENVDMVRQINAVFFTDAQYGWVAGNAFRHTTDGGQTWIQDNDWGTIYDLFFLDRQHGWACGNGSVNYYTTNGGVTWTAVSAPGGYTMSSIWFTDAANGWSVNIGGQVFRSTDGGRTWTLLATVPGNNLQMIQFFNLQEGWTIGGDAFYHTLDGGRTWSRIAVPQGTWAYSARFANRTNGVAVGEYGNIVRTHDGGQTWQTIAETGSGQRLWDVEYADPNTVILAGDNGIVSRSIDAGLTWMSIQSGAAGITHGFDSLDAQHAWAGQDAGEIAYTTNGGVQWERASVSGFDVYGHLNDVGFPTMMNGWAVGWNDVFPNGSRGLICRSDDGGRSWRQQHEITDFFFEGVEAINDQLAFAVGGYEFGQGGLVLRTVNGGSTWDDVTPNGSGGFRDVFFLNSSTGWIAGSAIYKTTNGGTTWTRQYLGNEMSSIAFADAQNGWAVGYAGTVLHTTDGGQTWIPQSIVADPLTAVTCVSVINPTTAWIAGWFGFVAYTTDGGATWHNETVPGGELVDFEDIRFTDAQQGWVGGNIGIWHRAGAGPQLSVIASCPSGGPIQVSWTGATRGGEIALIFAHNTGSFHIPNGNSCAGTELGLGANQIQLAYRGSAGANGSRIVNSTTGPGACGGYLQLLDVPTCGTSNLSRVE